MNVIKNFYNYFAAIGQSPDLSSKENKKIKLLNIYILITYHFVVLMPIADTLTGIMNFNIFICYISMFVSGILAVLLNKYHYHDLACIWWLLIVIYSVFMFSMILVPETYNEYYYVFVPGLAVALFNKITIPIITTVLCLFFFFMPYYVVDVYPKEVVDKLDISAILGIFITITLLFNYFKKVNIENEEKLEVAYKALELSKKNEVDSLQLRSLKTQMDPHFVFNAMNSIQNLVLKGNSLDAYSYLSKFSIVVRESLKMSEQKLVFFREEFSLLKNYLELEKLRFKDQFDFHLTAYNTDGAIQIPSMIIQPFVENSLYRIFHKKEQSKFLNIKFHKSNLLVCTIIDNGIRDDELERMSLKTKNEEMSFSLKNIKEHLRLLREIHKINIDFEYNISPESTTVCVVRIPYKTTEVDEII